jgi:Transposase DDE domain
MAASFGPVLRRFVDSAPVCVMVRLAMERALGADALDALFRDTADRQYERELLFSAVVGLMAPVVCGTRRSVHEAYQHAAAADRPAVTLASVYNKLNGIEPGVSAALVRHAAGAVGPLVRLMRQDRPSPLPGYPAVRIVDGGHLAGTEHRLAALRQTHAAALPGVALAVLDPAARLIVDVVPCEDAHTQERALVEQLFPRVEAGQVWLADRNFCTTRMLFGVAGRGAYFLVRQHAATLHWRELGPLRPRGRTGTGRVSEQAVELTDPPTGGRIAARRVRLELDEPTADGETEVWLLTNLPADGPRGVSAKQVADAYRGRWTIEHAFADLAVALRGEIDTLGYPRAALFGFCVAAAAYNLVALVIAALSAVHGRAEVADGVSTYHLAREWATVYAGMSIAAGPRAWAAHAALDDRAFVGVLKELARGADLRRYRKAKRGPKKRRLPWSGDKRIRHVATAKLLALRETAKTSP